MASEVPLFLFWSEFLKWILNKTGKFPKSIRFTLTSRIDNFALDVLEAILEARYASNSKPHLKKASIGIDKLRVFLRIAYELGHLDHKGYEFASRKLDEAGKMTGGWMKAERVFITV